MCTIQEISDLISNFKTNACGDDNVSPVMLQYCSPSLVSYIVHIINCCIETAYFPSSWKTSIILPLPKKSTIASLSDLRPIRILPALSKLFEKILYKQISDYVNTNNILPPCQSGFREGTVLLQL